MDDSGNRVSYESGAQRERAEGKGRYDLISPRAMHRLAIVMEKGAKKYAARNWEKGMPLSNYMDSALRHLNQYLSGMRNEDHLGHAMFNIMALIHTEEEIAEGFLPESLLDIPFKSTCACGYPLEAQRLRCGCEKELTVGNYDINITGETPEDTTGFRCINCGVSVPKPLPEIWDKLEPSIQVEVRMYLQCEKCCDEDNRRYHEKHH